MCSLFKEKSLLSMETIQNAFFSFQNYAPFSTFYPLSSIPQWSIGTRMQSSCFINSPEHEVLMVSLCDRPMSVVHSVFKHLLLLNHWANLDETWQGCSLGEALPKLCKRLNASH